MTLGKDLLSLAPTIKAFIDHLIEDPCRPGYHFAEPEGLGIPEILTGRSMLTDGIT